jgi:hypothetical protein
MEKTIDLLLHNIYNGYLAILHKNVINDYFGIQDNNENNEIIYGIYEDLITIKGIPKKLIENCYMTNRLDELIHKKNIHKKSIYYDLFLKNNIKIGKTFFYDNKTEPLKLSSDNYCPSCNMNYYLTSNSINKECSQCLINVCKLCSFTDNDDDNGNDNDDNDNNDICYKCKNPNLEIAINNKINYYKNIDTKSTITFEDIKILLRKQKFKCYICSSMIITYQWKPKCLHQFEFDLINKQLPYNKDNVRICCNFCINPTENNKKICKNKCHYDNTVISRKKNII